MNDVIELIKRIKQRTDGGIVEKEIKREVFAKRESISMTEFYQAASAGMTPDVKFVLADYFDYGGETELNYNGERYSIVRTYQSGQRFEIYARRKAGI